MQLLRQRTHLIEFTIPLSNDARGAMRLTGGDSPAGARPRCLAAAAAKAAAVASEAKAAAAAKAAYSDVWEEEDMVQMFQIHHQRELWCCQFEAQ